MADELTQNPQKVAAQEAYRRELERRSLDRIRIFNPMESDYVCYWDGYGNRFPAKQVSIYFRYIAVKSMHEIIDTILSQKVQKVIDDLQKIRAEKGEPALTPQQKDEIYSRHEYNITDKANRREWVKIIWRGIEEEYGMDKVIAAAPPRPQNTRPVDEQLLDEIDEAMLVGQEEGAIQKRILNANFNEGEETMPTTSEEELASKQEVQPTSISQNQPPAATTEPSVESVPEEGGHRGRGRPRKT